MDAINGVSAFIQKLGFPIFVAVFLLLRVDKTLRDILVILKGLSTAVKVLASLPEDDEEEEDAS
ncbi:MAG TPA: YvrJ family protein [Phycisphaerae bacterium]|nr:YvrJ family protein [Phycisphaerae bacterium]